MEMIWEQGDGWDSAKGEGSERRAERRDKTWGLMIHRAEATTMTCLIGWVTNIYKPGEFTSRCSWGKDPFLDCDNSLELWSGCLLHGEPPLFLVDHSPSQALCTHQGLLQLEQAYFNAGEEPSFQRSREWKGASRRAWGCEHRLLCS